MRSRPIVAVVFVFLAAAAGAGWGQSSQPSSGTRATQLPLSGRQQGGTSIQQSATVSSASSVNTLNTQVTVQGAYAGSVLDPNSPAGSISLTLADAVRRGLQFNHRQGRGRRCLGKRRRSVAWREAPFCQI